MNTNVQHVRVLCLCGALIAFGAQAQQTLVDDFTGYAAGTSLPGQGGWTQTWMTATFSVSAEGLSYARGSLLLDGGTNSMLVVDTDFMAAPGSVGKPYAGRTGDCYFSVLLKPLAGKSPVGVFMGCHERAESFGTGAAGVDVNGAVEFSAEVYLSMSATTRITCSVNQTYLLVGKLFKSKGATASYDRVAITINPTNAFESSATWTTASYNMAWATARWFIVSAKITAAENAINSLVDHVVVGDSYGDVVDAVPEPASLAWLLALAAACGCGRRR